MLSCVDMTGFDGAFPGRICSAVRVYLACGYIKPSGSDQHQGPLSAEIIKQTVLLHRGQRNTRLKLIQKGGLNEVRLKELNGA